MIVYRTDKFPEPEKLREIKKELDKIGKKYRTKIGKKINDYCKKNGFDMFVDIIMDLSFVGKVKEKGKKHDKEKKGENN